MDQLPLAEYGVAITAIAALAFTIRLFINHLKDKDDKFTSVISNHMNHSTEALTKVADAVDRNTQATERLTDKIK